MAGLLLALSLVGGARPACTRDGTARWLAIPRSMHDDAESQNAGVLVVNPLR
ncbi:MAG TPA: hypothetical protein VG755_28655 [Nannocystaceae bacterium]|nr:hypothetical protein [Nannocystaceae bacterium]